MSIPQDRRHTGYYTDIWSAIWSEGGHSVVLTDILDWRLHLSHTHNVRDGAFRGDDASKSIGVLFTKLFEENDTKFAQELVFPALFDHDREAGCEVSGLLSNFRALVVQSPKDGGNDLREVRFHPNTCKRKMSECFLQCAALTDLAR